MGSEDEFSSPLPIAYFKNEKLHEVAGANKELPLIN